MCAWKVAQTDAAKLRTMVEKLFHASTVKPGQSISAGVNTTGRSLLTPGCNTNTHATYPAYWVRDPAWLAETGFATADDIWGWITLMTQTMQGHSPRLLASGGIILPYSIADHINIDGSPVFYPGTYAADDTQGPPFGKYPPHDDQYWLSFSMYAYAKSSDDESSFLRSVPTPMGLLPLWQVCELAHNAFPVDQHTQLCIASADAEYHIVDWGYNDTITKTGKLLFPSLLRLESAIKLAHLFTGADMMDEAEMYSSQAHILRHSILETFYLEDERHEGWLLSATGIGAVPDVWGSAYALHLGILPTDLATALAKSLLRGYRERTTVLKGQVRHIPLTSGYWEKAQCQPGTYQNGAYWAYPAGWYIGALTLVDEKAAAELFAEFLRYQMENWDETFQTGTWECINPALNHYQNPGYLASIALPYITLRNNGIID
jgi:hypothetical protein